MRWLLILIAGGVSLLGCKNKSVVYSNARWNEAFCQEERWDYRGYNPRQANDIYTRYSRDEALMKLPGKDSISHMN